jgi:uncharacterized protein YndB with AHSA1/START domain
MTKLDLTVEPGKQDLVFRREFNAPAELVFKAYTDPRAIPQFWGPRYLTTTVDQMDVRPGGSWRFIQKDPQGNEYGFHGVYHDVSPSQRMVQTFEFEGMPGHVALETMTFEDLGGRTRITGHSVFQSVEDRDGMVSSGMESGLTELLDRLAEIVEKARV